MGNLNSEVGGTTGSSDTKLDIAGRDTLVPAMGSDIEPFLTPEQIAEVKGRLANEQFRKKLAAFMALQANYLQFGKEDGEYVRYSVGWVAIDNFQIMTQIAESPTWPESVSPPELYFYSIEALDEERFNG